MNFERHLQTGLAVVLIGFVGWVGVTVSQNSTLTARLDERMAAMSREMQALRESVKIQMSDRFSGGEGRALAHRLDLVEREIDKLKEVRYKQQK